VFRRPFVADGAEIIWGLTKTGSAAHLEKEIEGFGNCCLARASATRISNLCCCMLITERGIISALGKVIVGLRGKETSKFPIPMERSTTLRSPGKIKLATTMSIGLSHFLSNVMPTANPFWILPLLPDGQNVVQQM
jgi:hypothetical protein